MVELCMYLSIFLFLNELNMLFKYQKPTPQNKLKKNDFEQKVCRETFVKHTVYDNIME